MENKEMKVLIFGINDEYYSADIMEVERILGFEEPTKIPDSPSFVEGVINYEGNILPVISLSKRFGLKGNEIKEDAKIIVTKHNDNKKDKIGILVDAVSEVRDVSLDTLEEAPEIVAGISKRYIKGLIKSNKEIIIFLNLGTILTQEEKEFIENQSQV